MFIIDDLLCSPVNGFMWLVKEIHKAASQEIEDEAERLTNELSNLYLMLETGEITEQQFDERESQILDRLDAIRADANQAEEDQSASDLPPPDQQ